MKNNSSIKKQKGFTLTEEQVAELNEIIKKSGKQDNEFMVDLINELKVKDLTENEVRISPGLRKNFESDIAKLKNATNSIIQTFTSQMENMTVEKNTWEKRLTEEIEGRQSIIHQQKMQHDKLKALYEALQETHTEAVKELDTSKKSAQMCEKRLNDQDELIKSQKEKINELNQTIADQAQEFKQTISLADENKQLKEQVNKLTLSISIAKSKHDEEIVNLKERLTFESEKALIRKENELHEKFREKEKQIRENVRQETKDEVRSFYHEEFKAKENELKALLDTGDKQKKATRTRKNKTKTDVS
ncbi:hypothetical protein [Bacillus sp. RO1]|uniref:hypothetical protein n=1 Tax=Bacillus sp. RO1 TaxID=2722703 RepID=UPI0014563515|nr:hypothetical protein [Bacillus sp. RO1]NLP50235.1 hypothetical protein [Bacillus sp. RO1]